MKLHTIGSGSSGNNYLLDNGSEALVIECGLPIAKVKEAVDFQVSRIEAAFALHVHSDHSKKVKDYLNAGIIVYGSKDVVEKYPGVKLLEHKKTIRLGKFLVKPMEVKHDVENFCLLIKHPDFGNCLYASDLHYLPYTFRGLNQMIIEANYDINIIDERVRSGNLAKFLRERIINSHMEIQTVKGIMRANDLSKVNNIVLIHLSDGNSHEENFKREIENITGKKVHVASAGLVIDFNKEF